MSALKKILFVLFISLGMRCVFAFGVNEIEGILQKPQSVMGKFTQKRHLRALSTPLIGKGRFVLQPKLVLLWRTEKPFVDTVRISGRGVEQYSAATQRWLKDGKSAAQVQIFLGLLGGDTHALQQQFTVSVAGDARRWQMTLTPKTALSTQIFTGITVAGDSVVRTIVLDEKQGDRTEIVFDAVQINKPLSSPDQAALTF